MNLKGSSRRMKKAQTIPWPESGKRCAALFTNRKGSAAKPLRLALGACIIQAEDGFSYYSPIKIKYFNGNRRALRVGASHKNPTRRWRYQNKTIVLF